MNQVDWEKMKEEINISNVSRVTSFSLWRVTQEEFTINIGSQTSGNYTNTHNIDDNYESLIEENVNNITLIDNESFEDVWPPFNWIGTGEWNKEVNYVYDGAYSADFDGETGGGSGYLVSSSMNCLDANRIYVDFWWYDRGLDNDDLELEYWDGNSWSNHIDLNQVESGNGWHQYTEVITDSEYFVSDFRIRWFCKTVWSGETASIDAVKIKKSTLNNTYAFDVIGRFNLDLDTYPVNSIQTIEIQMRFRANDSLEKWYFKAYNWNSSTYNDIGFNSTSGHTPTTGWDYYTLNLTNEWQSYVNGNGTLLVKIIDQSPDIDQTVIDLDFFGVRMKQEGTQFTIENNGPLTVHLVSMWIIKTTNHEHYDINIFVNSAATKNYVRFDVPLPIDNYSVKTVTERGNIAVYSGLAN